MSEEILPTDAASAEDKSPPLVTRRWRTPTTRRQIGFLAAVFLAGIVAGASVAMIAAPEVLARRMTRARAGDMTKAMTSQLNLTPEQQAKVGAAVAPHTMAIGAIMGDAWAKVGQQMVGIDHDVMPLLTPQQQKAWRERAERMKHFRFPQPGDGLRSHPKGTVPPGPQAPTPPSQ